MGRVRVLFVCVHNSARSQMAEAFLKDLGGKDFQVESAGLEAGDLNLLAVNAMREIGIDISHNKTKRVFDLYKKGNLYDFVITVCDESNAGRCPTFWGIVNHLHWSFSDPSQFTGTEEEKLLNTRKVRDQIREKIREWLKNPEVLTGKE